MAQKIKTSKAINSKPTDVKKTTNEIVLFDLWKAIYAGYKLNGSDEDQKKSLSLISSFLKQEARKNSIFENYNILIQFDAGTMIKPDADKIYKAVASFKDSMPILLILYSKGGDSGSAYLIGKLCREYCNKLFIISVPREAKSAATLICCAANEIHMGSLSELGPIDPQLDDYPALGLKYSIEHIAELVKRYPESTELFARYLSRVIKPIDLGYCERIAESSLQYAEKLLTTHFDTLKKTPSEIANILVYDYKDHGFVIDKTEAEHIFGPKTIKTNTEEYNLGNTLYSSLMVIKSYFKILKYNFYLIGTIESEPVIAKERDR